MTRVRLCIVTVATLVAACATAAADVQRELIAVSGEPAGTTGGLFSVFGNARLNEAGEVLFWSRQTANNPANNDECAGAIPVGLGGTFFTTRGATDSVGGGCGNRSDVWFEFTDLSGLSSVQVQFYIAGAEFSQAAVGIYQNQCSPLVNMGCGTGSVVTVGFSDFMRSVKIRVGSTNLGQSGDGLLVVRQVIAGPLANPINSQLDGRLWLKDDAGLGPVLSEGPATAFDPTLVHESVGIAAFTGWGSAVTGAVQANPAYATTRGALMSLESGGAGAGVLAIDTVLPPPAIPTPTIPGPASLSEGGTAAYALLDGSSVAYGATVHLTGEPAPGFPLQRWRNFDQPAISATGKVAFRSRLEGDGVNDTNDVVLWKNAGAGPTLVVRSGQQAPNAKPGVVFSQFGADVGVDAAGSVAFWGELTGSGVDASNRSGVWSDRDGALAPVVRAGQLADVPNGAVFASFSRRPMMNAGGDIALVAYVTGGYATTTNNSAIWVFRADGSRRVLAREGDAAPGLADGVVFATFSDPVINDRGDVAFIATLRGGNVTPQTSQALYFGGAERGLVRIARSGDVLTVGGGPRTVKEILFGTGRPQAGHGQFNNSATLLYELAFTDRSTALAKSDVTCPADFDGSGVVSVPDIFAYLSAWFAQSPSAEWDGTAPIDVADLFAYLQQWFGGC